MQLPLLIDGVSATIVLGGTALATVLRAGWHELAVTGQALGGLWQQRLTAEQPNAEHPPKHTDKVRDGGLRRAAPETANLTRAPRR